MPKRQPGEWDSFEEDARSKSSQKGPRCGTALMLEDILDVHGPEAVMSVLRSLKNHRLTTASIHKALESRVPEGLPSVYSLGRHRRGLCSCPKEDA